MKTSRHVFRCCSIFLLFGLVLTASSIQAAPQNPATSKDEAACDALTQIANLTIISAEIAPAKGSTPEYCHVVGLIDGSIHWQMQLPLPANWNGRLLNIGNGGKAGNMASSDTRLAEGYAVANSNTGHDSGAEPDASFAFDNLDETIDFGWRAVHVTANASKTLVKDYYGKAQQYAYWEGCSTGGRQGLAEAQRFPYDFDGIVAGSPMIDYENDNIAHIWTLQKTMKDNYAGNLAFDIKGDGSYASLTKLNMLRDAVLAKCDAKDGIKDGIIDDPLKCDFNPDVDLASKMCPGDVNADNCYTKRQLATIKDLYRGPYDSKGKQIFKGLAFGSESEWAGNTIPNASNHMAPSSLGPEVDHANFLFYKDAPGVPPPDVKNLSYKETREGSQPEYAWWDFDFNDVTAGKGAFMSKILDDVDPDLNRFLNKQNGKLIIYQGWSDGSAFPNMALDYYKNVVATTFKGDYDAAHQKADLFMVPGMAHCGGGPGVNDWDKLPALVDWVEKGKKPDYIVAVHRSNARGGGNAAVENERKLCPYPQHGVYAGPAGGENDPANWKEGNFVCKADQRAGGN